MSDSERNKELDIAKVFKDLSRQDFAALFENEKQKRRIEQDKEKKE